MKNKVFLDVWLTSKTENAILNTDIIYSEKSKNRMKDGMKAVIRYTTPKILMNRKEKVMNRNVQKISRRAKLLAQQNHIDLSKIKPTGPDGRIIERDILRELEKNYLNEHSDSIAEIRNVDGAEDSMLEKESKSEAKEEITVTETAQSEFVKDLSNEDIDESEIEIEWIEIGAEPTAIVAAPINAVTKESFEKEKDSPKSEEKETTKTYGTDIYPHTDVIIPRTEMAPNGNPITITMFFDADEIVRLHDKIKENGETMGISPITLNDMIMFATAKVLKKNKALNAHFLGDKIRYFDGAHLGFFVDTDHGIQNLTIFDADRLSLSGFAKIAHALIRSARAGKVPSEKNKPSASFMVSNLGMLGVNAFTPILKEPQTGILGICALERKVKEVNGKDVFYASIPLSLTFDPRALGTTSASKFLRDLCISLENFELLLLK